MDDIKWFKFNPSRWMMGKIQKCPEVTQARFMRLCSLYWVKDCEMTIEDAIIEIDEDHFEILKAKKIVTIDSLKVYIAFLDEQVFEIKEDKKDKSTSGIVGNLKRWHKDIYEQFLAKKISLEKAIELSKVVADPSPPDRDPIAERSQNIADKDKDLDKTKTKTREDKDKTRLENKENESFPEKLEISPPTEKIDYIKFQKFFNDNRRNLSEVKKMTDARKKRISILQKQYGKECLMHAIEKAKVSNFLQGENSKNWTASFDWIFTPANFIKILEDNYGNKQQQSGKTNAEIYNDAINSETGKSFNWGKG